MQGGPCHSTAPHLPGRRLTPIRQPSVFFSKGYSVSQLIKTSIIVFSILLSRACIGQQAFEVIVQTRTVQELVGEPVALGDKMFAPVQGPSHQLSEIDAQDEGIKWLILRRVDGGRSTLLVEPNKGVFAVLDLAAGEYEVQTPEGDDGYPRLDYFTIGKSDDPVQPTDPPTTPTDPPTTENKFISDVRAAIIKLPLTAQGVRAKLADNVKTVRAEWDAGQYDRDSFRASLVSMSVALANLNQMECSADEFKQWSSVWMVVQDSMTAEYDKAGENMDVKTWMTDLETAVRGQ